VLDLCRLDPARAIAARRRGTEIDRRDDAKCAPGCPSPRLPPIHSAIGVRAPENDHHSGS
jgi:hypothetical protein